MKDEVAITIATHGWIGTEMTGGKFLLEEGAEMQWKEEREVSSTCTLLKLNFEVTKIFSPCPQNSWSDLAYR